MINNYGPIHPGLQSSSTGVTGKTATTPIYLGGNQVVKGDVALTPVEALLADKATRDALASFTLDTLAAMDVGYSRFEAIAA